MGSNWPRRKVIDLQNAGLLLVEDGNHGNDRPRPDEFCDTGVSFIRAADMDEGRVLFSTAQCINETARKRIRKGIGRPGDVLLSHKGTVGKVAATPIDAPDFVCSPQTTFYRTLDEDKLDRVFLFQFLKSREFQNELASIAGETDMAGYASLTNQRRLHIALPPIDEQRAIAHILGTVDDKVELNRRMNATLEAMARALFQSWFVDFDPVRAKAAGQTPAGMDKATADLFPAAFETATVGKVPSGWRVRYLLELCDFEYGKPLKDADRAGGHVPVYGSNGIVGWHDQSLVEGPGIVIGRKGTAGTVTWSATDFFPIDTTFWVKPKSNAPPLSFLFLQLGNMKLNRLTADSAVPGLNRNAAYSQLVVSPTLAVLRQFENVFMPLFSLIHRNALETRTLSQLRETLLPVLLQGRLTATVK